MYQPPPSEVLFLLAASAHEELDHFVHQQQGEGKTDANQHLIRG